MQNPELAAATVTPLVLSGMWLSSFRLASVANLRLIHIVSAWTMKMSTEERRRFVKWVCQSLIFTLLTAGCAREEGKTPSAVVRVTLSWSRRELAPARSLQFGAVAA